MINTKQSVSLIFCSPLWLIANGIRYSHNNHNKSDTDNILELYGYDLTERPDFDDIGIRDFDLIKRVGFKYKHESVLEFVDIVYHIECSRAMLQELARHRHISLTVKSTRYTLKELKNIEPTDEVLKEYLVITSNKNVDKLSIEQLKDIVIDIKDNALGSNDIAKYCLPEAFKTELQLKTNLRELLHILKLRTSKDALWEFRQVAYQMFNVLPDEYKELILCDKQISKQIKEIEND